MRKPAALFSLNDTTNAVLYAKRLIKAGWEIIASAETVRLLRADGLPVTDISDYTGVRENYGFPPTLHAKVEYALTSKSAPGIKLVYVIPYPLSKGNDIGGRTLLALAVKGGRIPVTSTKDMEMVSRILECSGRIQEKLKRELCDKACFEISRHYASLIADKSSRQVFFGESKYALMNGENPYQVPANAYSSEDGDRLSLLSFERLSGEAPCFTNMADADCILQTMCLAASAFKNNLGKTPWICIAAKHGNPCGMAISWKSKEEAIDKALFGDPLSIWGGEVIVNFGIDAKLAGKLLLNTRREELFGNSSWMLDIILAPSFSTQAVKVLGKRAARKLFANEALKAPFVLKGMQRREVRGGFLSQPRADYVLKLPRKNPFTKDDISSMIIAWAVSFSSNLGGNEVALAGEGSLAGSGGGPSTVAAAAAAIAMAERNRHDTAGSVFAADAFFPFTDAPELLSRARTKAGCVPSGGKHGREVMDFFRSKGIKMLYLPEKYRGFCRH